jgi:hypothetical protein
VVRPDAAHLLLFHTAGIISMLVNITKGIDDEHACENIVKVNTIG